MESDVWEKNLLSKGLLLHFFFCKTEAKRNPPSAKGVQTRFFRSTEYGILSSLKITRKSLFSIDSSFPILCERNQSAKLDKHILYAGGQKTRKYLKNGKEDSKFI